MGILALIFGVMALVVQTDTAPQTIVVVKVDFLVVMKQVIRVKKTRGAAAPHTQNTWESFLGSEEPSLKLLRSAKLQHMNF